MQTTLNKIKEHTRYLGHKQELEKLLRSLGKTETDDESLSIEYIIETNGVKYAIWCLRAVDGYEREIKLFAIWCDREVKHLLKDERSVIELDIIEAYINGKATEEEMEKACAYAHDAYDAYTAVYFAACADSYAAANAAYGVAYASASYTATDANNAASNASKAMRERQKEKLLEIINKG